MEYLLDLENRKITIDNIDYRLFFEECKYVQYDLDVYVVKVTPKYITLFGRKIRIGQDETYPFFLNDSNGRLGRIPRSKFDEDVNIEREIKDWMRLCYSMYTNKVKEEVGVLKYKNSRY